MTEEPRHISVSRDALRADLAEMELRLRTYFDMRIAAKAENSELEQLTKRVDLHDGGVFPPAWQLQISSIVDSRIEAKVRDSWTLRSTKAAVLYAVIALAGLILSAYALAHTLTTQPAPRPATITVPR